MFAWVSVVQELDRAQIEHSRDALRARKPFRMLERETGVEPGDVQLGKLVVDCK